MSISKPITVAIIEDQEILKEQVIYYLQEVDDIEVVHDAGCVETYLEHLDAHSDFKPDVLLLDIGLPGMSGLEGLPIIRERLPETDVIMLTSYEQQDVILKALCTGAVGYISKRASQSEVADGIRIVNAGGSYMSPQIAREIVQHLVGGKQIAKPSILSERQVEIIDKLVEGASYNSIAEELFISIETVRTHIKKMYRALEVNNKAEAIAMYLRGEIS